MNRKVILLLILLFPSPTFSQTLLPGNTTLRVGPLIIDFDTWLGADKVTLNVGREAEVRLYVLNVGNAVDSYTIDVVKPTRLDVNLASNTIENVYPQDVKFISILISAPRIVENEIVEFNVSSVGDPTVYRSLNLTVTSLAPESLPESNITLVLLLISSLLILKKLWS